MTARFPKSEGSPAPEVMGTLNTFIPMAITRRPGKSSVVPPEDAALPPQLRKSPHHTTLINGIARAFYWQRLIDLGIFQNGQEIAEREGLDQGTVNECLRLTLLAPSVVQSIWEGTHPRGLTLHWLTRNPVPLLWSEQHERFRSIGTGGARGGESQLSS